MKKLFFVCTILLSVLVACNQRNPGPFEKAGERADEIGDNIAEGKNPLHKKSTLEKAGEAVDETIGTDNRR
ncbi:MAG: hypothetical protein J0M12_00965 [Deltaproteobacteria bacterium]|nr:hypothetical protein [Deltaproteobacteria bacterium]